MTDHSPRQCHICGEYHCVAGCVPIDLCYTRVSEQCAQNLVEAGIIQSSEKDMAIAQFKRLDPKDLVASLMETHYLRENKPTDIMSYPINSATLSRN